MAVPKGYTVDVNGYKQTTQTYTVLPGGTKGETLRFRLPPGNKVELTDNNTHLGPKAVQVKKVGEDLHLAFPGSSLRSPDVIIEDFYPRGGKPGALVGRAAGGKAYDYAGVSGSAGLEQAGVTASLAGKPVSEWGETNAAIEPVSGDRAQALIKPAAPSGGAAGSASSAFVGPKEPVTASAAAADEGGYKLGTLGWVLGGVGLVGLAAAGGGGGGGGGGNAAATNVSDGPVSRVEAGAVGTVDDNVAEGQTLVYTVSLRDKASTPTQWSYALTGTAGTVDLADIQFSDGVTLNNGLLTVPAGVQSFTVTIRTAEDTAIEAHESIVLTVNGVANTATLLDNDKPTVASVEPGAPGAADDRVIEGAPLAVRVTLSDLSPKAETYKLSVTGGATPADYSVQGLSDGATYDPATGLITVPANVGAFTLTLSTAVDATTEPSETLIVGIDGARGTATVADLLPASISAPATTEGANLVYTVTLNGSSANASAHAFNLSGVTATAGADFGAAVFSNGVTVTAAGVLSVPAGVSSFTLTVPTVRDNAVEGDETLRLSIDGLTALGTISANGSQAVTAFSTSAASVSEGGSVTYSVSLSGPSNKTETHVFKINEQAASTFGTLGFSNGVSYNPGTQQLSVPAGVTAFTVTLNTANNARDEVDQALNVSLGGILNPLTVRDDDPAPAVNLSGPASFNEGAGTAAYTVSLSQASGQAVSVNYSTVAGSAAAGSDFAASSGTLTFAPGTTTQTVTVNVTNDTSIELDEAFSVALSAPVNATLGNTTVNTTVTDNDQQVISSVSAATTSLTEGGTLAFDVRLNAGSPRVETYTLQIGGSASAGVDLGAATATNGVTIAGQTVSVPVGIDTFRINIPTVDDAQIELTESVQITLEGRSASASILDNEPPAVVSLAGPAQVSEAAGTATYTVTLSQASAFDVRVNYAATAGTASNADFSPVSGTLTIAAGARSGTISVPLTDDAAVEGGQSFALTLSTPANATLGLASVTTTILDNDTQTVTANQATAANVPEGGTATFVVTLSGAAEIDQTHRFSLTGTATQGRDYTAPAFSDGVSYDPGDGTIKVPAGVGSFSVSVDISNGDGFEFAESVIATVDTIGAQVLIPLNFGQGNGADTSLQPTDSASSAAAGATLGALLIADTAQDVLVLTDRVSTAAVQVVYAEATGPDAGTSTSSTAAANTSAVNFSLGSSVEDLLVAGSSSGPWSGA